MWWIIKREETSHKISELFSQYSNWLDNPESGRDLRRRLFISLLTHTQKPDESLYLMKQIITLEREVETKEKIL